MSNVSLIFGWLAVVKVEPWVRCVVCSLFVCNAFIEAEWYTLPKNVQIGKQGCPTTTVWFQVGPPWTILFPPPNYSTDSTPNTCVVNWGQTALVSGMVTIDTLWELAIPLSDTTVPDEIHSFSQNRDPDRPNLRGALQSNHIRAMVTNSRLQTFADVYIKCFHCWPSLSL